MYISTLFTSSVILNRWWLNSITGHIQIYVGIAAIISLFRDITWPSAIIFYRNCSSSTSVCCGSIVTKLWIQIKPLKNSLKNVHICEDWIKIRLHGRGREGDYVWIGLRLHGRLDGKYSNHFQAVTRRGLRSVTIGNGLRNRFSKRSESVRRRQRESVERVSERASVCVWVSEWASLRRRERRWI